MLAELALEFFHLLMKNFDMSFKRSLLSSFILAWHARKVSCLVVNGSHMKF